MANMTVERVRRAFGANVRKKRIVAGMSQTELAEKIGVRQSYISCIESAKEGVTVDTITRLSIALKTQPSRLLCLI